MNPQLQSLMERNPEVARIMEDPEVLQQSMRAMRNPAMMREMMRQADRSMSNLETVPGGMDALRRMHNEIADPMYDALTGSDGPNRNSAPVNYDQNTDGAPNSEALPNPW